MLTPTRCLRPIIAEMGLFCIHIVSYTWHHRPLQTFPIHITGEPGSDVFTYPEIRVRSNTCHICRDTLGLSSRLTTCFPPSLSGDPPIVCIKAHQSSALSTQPPQFTNPPTSHLNHTFPVPICLILFRVTKFPEANLNKHQNHLYNSKNLTKKPTMPQTTDSDTSAGVHVCF